MGRFDCTWSRLAHPAWFSQPTTSTPFAAHLLAAAPRRVASVGTWDDVAQKKKRTDVGMMGVVTTRTSMHASCMVALPPTSLIRSISSSTNWCSYDVSLLATEEELGAHVPRNLCCNIGPVRLELEVGWKTPWLIFLREKYYSDWKNKSNKTDYKSDEHSLNRWQNLWNRFVF
jgi:hypothetical protein